jgi:hypothetical protein
MEVEGSLVDTVEQQFSTGVPQEFRERWQRSKKTFRNKKLSKSMISIIFKNNTMIRILAIELLNTILLLTP